MTRFLTFVAAVALVLACQTPAFAQSTNNWDGTWEGKPLVGDPVSAGPSEFHVFKKEVRERLETGHDFDTAGAHGLPDTGRHLAGSARMFTHATDCSLVTAIIEADAQSNTALTVEDDGRLCVELDDADLWYWDGATLAWVEMTHDVPTIPAQSVNTIATDTASGTTNLALLANTWTEYTTVGTANDLLADVTCPADAGNYTLLIQVDISSRYLGAGTGNTRTRLVEQVGVGAAGAITASDMKTGVTGDTENNVSYHYVRTGGVAGERYRYVVEMFTSIADTLFHSSGFADHNARITATCMRVE